MTTTPAPPSRPPRPNAEYRWTGAKAAAFVDALSRHGKVAVAAREVGMSRQSAYRLKQRFARLAELWPAAQAAGRARRLAKTPPPLRQGDALSGRKVTDRAAR